MNDKRDVETSRVTPERITTEVGWSTGSRVVEVVPAYESVWPNRRPCPPECRQASVTVAV
jgi:hypothetical protein